jgi:hypothetical protein
MIYRSLRMSLKEPLYHYVRTVTEFEHFIGEFAKSDYRYLHISCHGSKHGVSTTLGRMTNAEFAKIVGPKLNEKRLFLSTCLASTQAMADAVFSNGKCTSLAGPTGKINFDDSVILWTSFYHLMFKANNKAMKRDLIKETMAKCALLVGKEMNFYVPRRGKSAVHTIIPAHTPTLAS